MLNVFTVRITNVDILIIQSVLFCRSKDLIKVSRYVEVIEITICVVIIWKKRCTYVLY